MALLVKNVLSHPSGRFSYRRVYPVELRPFIPGSPTQYKRSIGRRDEPGFLQRYEEAAAECATILAKAGKLRDGSFDTLDAPTIAYLAEAYRAHALQRDEDARWHPKNWGGAWRDQEWTVEDRKRWAALQGRAVLEVRNKYKELRARGDVTALLITWHEVAVAFAGTHGRLIDPADSNGILRLCRTLNDVAIEVADGIRSRDVGQNVPTPAHPTPSAPEKQTTPISVSGLYEAYSAASGMTQGVRAEWRKYIAALISFLGHDDATILSESDVRAWRDKLLVEPTARGLVRKPVTVRDKYLRALHATLVWAVGERHLENNAAAGVKVRVPKQVKLRERDFTEDEARQILEASLFPAPRRLSAGYALARRWIPWLCAYTGARVNEISQLRGQDVREIDGIWTIRITPEAGAVKGKEARVVPLHLHLIDQGFPAVAAAHGSDPIFFDPSRQRRSGEGSRHFKKVGERLAEWVREDVGIKDEGLQPNHGWRHTFKTRAFAANIQERVADAIQGHTPATVSRRYGKVTLQTMHEAIQSLPRFAVEVDRMEEDQATA
jgi:integrase